jgi:hypothetical protein
MSVNSCFRGILIGQRTGAAGVLPELKAVAAVPFKTLLAGFNFNSGVSFEDITSCGNERYDIFQAMLITQL